MFRLTRFTLRDTLVTPAGTATTWFQRWWQSSCEAIEKGVTDLQQAIIDIQAAQDAADAAQTTADNAQPHDADLDTISGQTNTPFGLLLLTEASATHLLGTTLSAYTKAQTDSAISTALTPYITTAAANAAFQPLDADLTAIALLATTSYGRGALTLANSAAALTYFGAQAAGSYQPLDSDLTAIALLTTTTFGRSALTWADAAAGRTALSVYSSTQTDSAITAALSPYITTTAANAAIATALVPYLTSTTAASTYQPVGSYVTYTAQTITTGQQAQARTNINAQVAGSYATGTGSATGTNTGDETATTIKSKLGITTLSGSNTGDQTLSLTVPSIFTSGGSSTSALSFTVASQAANLVWASPNGASGAPTFRALVAADIPALPAYQPAGTYATGTGTASGTNTGDETATTIKSKLGITTLSGSNTGDQTLSLTVPSIFTSGGSSTSALSFTVASQTANMVWAAPNGAAGAPSFRLLVAADIPSLPAYQPAGSYQPLDATLTAQAGVTTAADQVTYWTGVDTAAQTPLTAFGRTLIDDADALTARATLNIESRTVLAADADYTVLPTDRLLLLSTTFTANRTFTLPAVASVNFGQPIVIVPNDGSATNRLGGFTLTIAPASGERINRATASLTITDPDALLVFYSMGGGRWAAFGRGIRHSNPIRVLTTGASTTLNMSTDHTLIVRKTTGSATGVTLPAGAAGVELVIKDGKGDAATNPITITPAAGNIDGAATYVINTARGAVTLKHDGTEWTVIGKI